jgi:hypothetical protein
MRHCTANQPPQEPEEIGFRKSQYGHRYLKARELTIIDRS